MKHKIKPIKQQTEFGCLATCCAMIKNYLFGVVFSQEKEIEKTSKAFNSETKFNEHFHIKELFELGCDIKIFIETPYMKEGYGILNSRLGCKIPINLQLIGANDYETLLREEYVLITLVDLWSIDMIIHTVHYIIVNGFDENNFYIIDPKYKMEIKVAKERFIGNIILLKKLLG